MVKDNSVVSLRRVNSTGVWICTQHVRKCLEGNTQEIITPMNAIVDFYLGYVTSLVMQVSQVSAWPLVVAMLYCVVYVDIFSIFNCFFSKHWNSSNSSSINTSSSSIGKWWGWGGRRGEGEGEVAAAVRVVVASYSMVWNTGFISEPQSPYQM